MIPRPKRSTPQNPVPGPERSTPLNPVLAPLSLSFALPFRLVILRLKRSTPQNLVQDPVLPLVRVKFCDEHSKNITGVRYSEA